MVSLGVAAPLYPFSGNHVAVSGGRRLTLVAVAPLNWSHPPAGVDPNAPKRFAFRLSGG